MCSTETGLEPLGLNSTSELSCVEWRRWTRQHEDHHLSQWGAAAVTPKHLDIATKRNTQRVSVFTQFSLWCFSCRRFAHWDLEASEIMASSGERNGCAWSSTVREDSPFGFVFCRVTEVIVRDVPAGSSLPRQRIFARLKGLGFGEWLQGTSRPYETT